MSVLAIDAGTTGVTAVVVSATGDIVAKGYQEFAQHFPRPGWVEHAPEEIWQATLEATRDALKQVDVSELRGIGITNQRETVLLWDRETLGSPRRAIVWQDRRTADICLRMREDGHEERITELTGLRLDPYFSGTKLRWLAEQEPRTWALVEEGRYAVGTVDSYLVARMTRGLEHVTDVSNAARTLLHDLDGGGWSGELCSLFGVPVDALPELVPSWGGAATTDPRAFLGLSLPVAGLVADRSAAHLGLGCLDAGDASWDDAASSLLVTTGRRPVRTAQVLTTAAWRSPDGADTFALEVASGVDRSAEWLPGVREAAPDLASLRVGDDVDDRLCHDLGERLGLDVRRASAPDATLRGAALLALRPADPAHISR